MRKKIKEKAIVAVLLPIFFLLVATFSVYQWNPLKADDHNTHLVDVKVNGKKVDENYSVTEPAILLEMSSKKRQVLRFLESDNYGVSFINDKNEFIPAKKVSKDKLTYYTNLIESAQENIESTETTEQISTSNSKTSSSQEAERIESHLFYVEEKGKNVYCLLLEKEQKIQLSISNKTNKKLTNVALEVPKTKEQQILFSFNQKKENVDSSKVLEKIADSSESKETSNSFDKDKTTIEKNSSSSNVKPATATSSEGKETSKQAENRTKKKSKSIKQTKEETERDLVIDQLLKKDYEEKDSFKAIELPIKTANAKEEKNTSSPISVTGIKMNIKDGTDEFDEGNDNPGYDSGSSNYRVRSFDSISYAVAFSLEANDPTTTYSNIKYRVEMNLPNAYSLDSSGKQRFNAEVVDSEHGKLIDTSDNTKESIGFSESTIKGVGNYAIMVPMIVNVYGAQHNTIINPAMKITIISAQNDKTGKTEEMNLTYDKADMPELNLDKITVSAKSSVKPTLIKGNRVLISDFASKATGNDRWDAVGIGMTLGLKSISGRDPSDFRGATFPNGKIEVEIGSDTVYQETIGGTPISVPTSETASLTTHTRPVWALASTVATSEKTGWTQNLLFDNTFNFTDEFPRIPVPNGKTEEIHVVEPSVEERQKIGVYDTGKVDVKNDGLSIKVANSEYAPIYNPYTYNLISGTKTNNNEKIFSSSMMVVQWTRQYLQNKTKGGILSTDLKIKKIRYEDQDYSDNSVVTISDITIPRGSYTQVATFVRDPGGLDYSGLSSTNSWANTNGDATVGQGEAKIFVGGASIVNQAIAKQVQTIIRWNANSFEYDMDRSLYSQGSASGLFIKNKTRYGVGKSSRNHPNLTISEKTAVEGQYDWYTSPEEAIAHGKISAVKFVNNKLNETYSIWQGVPVKVIGIAGDKDKYGNSTAALSNTYWYDSFQNLVGKHPNSDTYKGFTPSTFDSEGNMLKQQSDLNGDSIFIKSFKIQTTTTPDKPTYKTNENVKWKVEGNLLTEGKVDYGVKLTTTLPKGLKYSVGSSVDSRGDPLPEEPDVVENDNGTTTLIWNFSNVNPSNGDTVEIIFETLPSLRDLTFNNQSLANVRVKTVGEMWVQSDSSQRDTSREVQRSSAGQVQLYQIQQIVLTKEVNKSLIEVGEKDDADLAASSDITYKITLENYSSDKLSKVNVLDVLPYNGDSFGSNFDGSYTVKNIKIVEGSGTINYTTDAASEKTDPNDVYGWGLYVPGNSEPAIIKNAKGFLVSTEELSIGDKLAFEVTISVQGQKTANIYRNRATFNSHLKLPVNSNIVQTQVLSRDLTGYVWYDDNYNGVIESNEDPVGDISVKLYRTSLVNSSYEKQLVKESLTGQKFVDGSGNSLIKTKTTGQDKGKYQFPDLPEGEYLAEFMVGDIVVTKKIAIVTKQLVGSDPKLNSKADPDTFKTPEYNHPVLKDLPTLLTGTDKVHHVTDVNAGLTRLSKIKLFKYEEGTVIDTNGDGKLSDAEIEASSTNALKGAEFQLYKGDSDNPDPADKIGDPVKTDSDGWLEFSSLPPGDYTIIETKAPDGFELLKDPIKVTVPTYNHIAIVHVPDKGQTELPFTGGTKAMRFILIGAASLLVIGMTGVFLHFRPIKGRGGK
ncbi:SpaA isopeptide-forming pilin-related protein [Enterococcus sp. AZ196]|uniref:SpaA isopeptide-forming pilin-related protein n=1 Tax=Enterococcus sp. AZ196 TaxID=2774659 RepID=UPI003D2B21D6